MRNFRSVLTLSTAITAALVFAVTSAGPAVASGHSLLREDLQGVFPLSDPVNHSPIIAGVSPGGAPWVVDEGSQARVREDGRITVVVRHLIIPGRGNPIAQMAASLVCNDMVVDSTRPFAVSPEGDGQISDHIMAVDEDECDNPVVLVRNATDPAALGAYFAFAMDD